MRIPSGKTDQTIAFVALDSGDGVTRLTGLSSFTVYRSRNGGTATLYTTPTVAELDNTNMPGVYVLTVDEDTTIASTSESEEYVVHITKTGMLPVTRAIELYRPAHLAVIEGSYTLAALVRGIVSVLIANWSKSGATVTFRDLADTKDRLSADVIATARSDSTISDLD